MLSILLKKYSFLISSNYIHILTCVSLTKGGGISPHLGKQYGFREVQG